MLRYICNCFSIKLRKRISRIRLIYFSTLSSNRNFHNLTERKFNATLSLNNLMLRIKSFDKRKIPSTRDYYPPKVLTVSAINFSIDRWNTSLNSSPWGITAQSSDLYDVLCAQVNRPSGSIANAPLQRRCSKYRYLVS